MSLKPFLLVIPFFVGAQCFAGESLFRVKADRFSFSYPESWVVMPALDYNAKAMVGSKLDGTNCAVAVKVVSAMKGLSNAKAMSFTSADKLLQGMKMNFPDAVSVLGGDFELDLREAVFAYIDYTAPVNGRMTSMRSLMLQTFEYGKIYMITCGGQRHLFESHQLEFERVVASFSFE